MNYRLVDEDKNGADPTWYGQSNYLETEKWNLYMELMDTYRHILMFYMDRIRPPVSPQIKKPASAT